MDNQGDMKVDAKIKSAKVTDDASLSESGDKTPKENTEKGNEKDGTQLDQKLASKTENHGNFKISYNKFLREDPRSRPCPEWILEGDEQFKRLDLNIFAAVMGNPGKNQLDRIKMLKLEQFCMKFVKAFRHDYGNGSLAFACSIPRAPQVENGYKRTVKDIICLLQKCKEGKIDPSSTEFPLQSSIEFAKTVNAKEEQSSGNENQRPEEVSNSINAKGTKSKEPEDSDATDLKDLGQILKESLDLCLGPGDKEMVEVISRNRDLTDDKTNNCKELEKDYCQEDGIQDEETDFMEDNQSSDTEGDFNHDYNEDITDSSLDAGSGQDADLQSNNTDSFADGQSDENMNTNCEESHNNSEDDSASSEEGTRTLQKKYRTRSSSSDESTRRVCNIVTSSEDESTNSSSEEEGPCIIDFQPNSKLHTCLYNLCKLDKSDDFFITYEDTDTDVLLDISLPQYLIFLLSDGKENVVSEWCGQIQARVDPGTKILSILMYDYSPSYSEADRQTINSRILNKRIGKEIHKELEKFECCRQMRMDIKISQLLKDTLYFFRQDDNTAIVILRFHPAVEFFQRFVNVNGFDQTKWKGRQPFLPFDGGCFTDFSSDYMLVLGGTVKELSDLTAQILLCKPKIKVNHKADRSFMQKELEEMAETKNVYHSSQLEDAKPEPSATLNLDRRSEILNVLRAHDIIDQVISDDLEKNIKVTEKQLQEKTCNFLNELELEECFKDYVNYKCEDAAKLDTILKMKFDAYNYGMEMKDLALKYPERYSFKDITVAEYLKAEKDKNSYRDKVYFSFCHNATTSEMNVSHCKGCKQCTDWKTNHCSYCNKCTYTYSNGVCEHCGFNGEDIHLQPGSVDLPLNLDPFEHLFGGKPIPNPWKGFANLSTTDIPKWASDVVVKEIGEVPFILEEYLFDDLGLGDIYTLVMGYPSRGPRHLWYVGSIRQLKQLRRYEEYRYSSY